MASTCAQNKNADIQVEVINGSKPLMSHKKRQPSSLPWPQRPKKKHKKNSRLNLVAPHIYTSFLTWANRWVLLQLYLRFNKLCPTLLPQIIQARSLAQWLKSSDAQAPAWYGIED